MSILLAMAIVLLPLSNHGIDLVMAWNDKDFFKYCPPSQCSQHGPEIRFPFCLESSNTSSSCGCRGRSIRKLACSGQDTILVHPVLGQYNVSIIDYKRSSMKINPMLDPCLVLQQKLIISKSSSSPRFDDINDDPYFEILFTLATLVYCSREFTPGVADRVAGPVSCLSNATHFFYLVADYQDMYLLPLDCKVIPVSDGINGRLIPIHWSYYPIYALHSHPFKEGVDIFLSIAETTVYWEHHVCSQCEISGGSCAFSSISNQAFCMPDPHGMINSNYLEPYIILSSCFSCNKVCKSIK
jgi:hypothetical protein